MGNQTVITELYLSGLSDLPSLQLPLFISFLLIYLLTLTWNLLIISLIVTDSHLHTPMYFFLGNLASLDLLDLCCSSVTVPRMLFDLQTQRRMITLKACLAQVFFFMFLAGSDMFLLAVMSYDRYVAICHPLHYMQIMRWKVCVQLASIAWFAGFFCSCHLLYALKLRFCGRNVIESFFCDLPQLFLISCSDVFINILLVIFMICFFGIISLIVTFLPYVYIIQTVLKIEGDRSKVFSTCSSHLTVVFIFYGSSMCNYFRPNSSSHFAGEKVISVFYTVVTPLLNPVIYSLRNQDFRRALRYTLIRIVNNALKKS
ncbi:LOW QUALITY PROTEIN: olfactory receptor 5V1-like [Gastrophryne carolinensis]